MTITTPAIQFISSDCQLIGANFVVSTVAPQAVGSVGTVVVRESQMLARQASRAIEVEAWIREQSERLKLMQEAVRQSKL